MLMHENLEEYMTRKLSKMDKYNHERKMQSETRRAQVLDVAEQLMLKKGLANVSMNEIMEEAGISKPTFYRFFDNIHEIIFAIEYKMIQQVYQILIDIDLKDLSLDELGYRLNMRLVESFSVNHEAYRFIGMFDNFYADQFPNEELAQEYQKLLRSYQPNIWSESGFADQSGRHRIIMFFNLTMSFLYRLASRGKMLEKYQGLSIETQLDDYQKVIRREFNHE